MTTLSSLEIKRNKSKSLSRGVITFHSPPFNVVRYQQHDVIHSELIRNESNV